MQLSHWIADIEGRVEELTTELQWVRAQMTGDLDS
jgi:hypothetical protein